MIRSMVKLSNWVSGKGSVPWTQHIDPERLISDRAEDQRQKIREKLRLDIEAIRERRRKEKPFPVGSFEELQANSIWEKVLEHLTEPCDITNAYFTCPVFQEILEDKRKLALLPETLEIMRDFKSQRNDVGQRRLNFLRLREASKSWRKVVDRAIFEAGFLEDSTWHLHLENTRDWDVFFARPEWCRLTSTQEVESALCSLASPTETSSSPLRKLFIWQLYPDSETFFSAVERLLDSHGEWVWLLKFYGKGELADYDHLCRLLRKMPRLKALILRSVTKPVQSSSPQDLVNLQEKLEQNPFPRLDSLLYFHSEWNVSPLLLSRIYRKCSNLKTVLEEDTPNIAGRETKSLQRLSLERCRTSLRRLIVTTIWQLKVLEVTVSYDSIPLTCSLWWPALNRIRETLEYLTTPGIRRDDPNVQLQVDRVKVLNTSFTMACRTVVFDDFLNLKSLEKLSVSCVDEKDLHFQNQSGLVQVAGFLEKMEQSNIWLCFRDLRQLELIFFGLNLRRQFIRHGLTLSRYSMDETGYLLWVLEGVSGLINPNG